MMIQAAIFDFGGVILRTEDHVARERLAARLGTSPEELYRLVFNSPSARLATVGELTTKAHWEAVRTTLGISTAELPVIQAEFWEGDRLDGALVEYIRTLRSRVKTALLSNAWDNLHTLITDHWKIADAFDSIVISAEVGLAKPDLRIFQITVEKLGVLPAHAVLIDDSSENIQAARTFGLKAIRFQSPEQAQSELECILEAE